MASDAYEDSYGWRGLGKEQSKGLLLDHHLDVTEVLSLMESRDTKLLEEVKAIVNENLHAKCGDPCFLCGLVEYYIATKSTRCLDILTGIREPYDKHLFDKIYDCMKGHYYREQVLLLLGHIVRRQPPWLHRIAHHKVLPLLLQVLKTDTNIPHLMNGILIIVTLLPIIPALSGPHLPEIFEVFSRLCSWNTKKTVGVPEAYFLHLHVALNTLFCRLYAMYPCNFLAFLRSHYGGRENGREHRENLYVFSETIKPLLERVRLHPMLVTASKEMELSVARWKNMETHDIIVQCSKVSLDTVEGMQEDEDRLLREINSHPGSSAVSKQGSLSDCVNIHLPIEPGSLIAEVEEFLTMAPSDIPLQISDFSPTSDTQHTQEDEDPEGISTSLITSVASIISKADSEAESDLPDTKIIQDEVDGGLLSTFKGPPSLPRSDNTSKLPSRPSEGDVVTAEEAKEENQWSSVIFERSPDQVEIAHGTVRVQGGFTSHPLELNIFDQKLEQLMSSQESIGIQQHHSHFVSTTDTLTATVTFSVGGEDGSGSTLANTSLTSSSAQDEDHGCSIAPLGGASNVMLERLVHGINRLRFFSHCGHPPEIPIDWLRRSPTMRKSHSWPVLKADTCSVSPRENTHPVGSPDSTEAGNKVVSNLETVGAQQAGDFCWTPPSKPEELAEPPAPVTHAVSPVIPVPESPAQLQGHQDSCSVPTEPRLGPLQPATFTYLAPGELLDRYLQLGSQVYLQGLSLTSSKDTDWTHFGGPPPADEMMILKGEISLLHTQLLFERYRREVHAERNRRLLGKAKKAKALEEQNTAMKDQLILQEKEIQELTHKLALNQARVQDSPAATYHQELHGHLRLLQQDNQILDSQRKKMEYELEQQKKDILQLRTNLDEAQCQLQESSMELASVCRKANRCDELEKEVKRLGHRLAVLHALHQRHLDKLDHEAKPTDLAIQLSHMQESAKHDIEELKRQNQSQSIEIEGCRMRIQTMEQAVASKELIIEEQKQLLEAVKSCRNDIVQSKQKHIKSLQSICQRQEEEILELRSRLCIQDSIAKPVPSSFHQSEVLSHGHGPWHPAQEEPAGGIQATLQDLQMDSQAGLNITHGPHDSDLNPHPN